MNTRRLYTAVLGNVEPGLGFLLSVPCFGANMSESEPTSCNKDQSFSCKGSKNMQVAH